MFKVLVLAPCALHYDAYIHRETLNTVGWMRGVLYPTIFEIGPKWNVLCLIKWVCCNDYNLVWNE